MFKRTEAKPAGAGEPVTAAPSTDGEPSAKPKRRHKATYSTDKKKGGYLVRVQGPDAGKFAERTVPVTRRDGTEHPEKLVKLLWTGADVDTGEPVALYTFEQLPPKKQEVDF